MRILKTIAVAFSLYSRIPMPHFPWEEEDMKHNMVFLPWIGAVIGGVSFLLYRLLSPVVPTIGMLAVLLLVPIVTTGGFHLDGFMDVQDALSSFRSREEKLEILSDPHIGAFSVIRLAELGLIWVFGLSALLRGEETYVSLFCVSFFLCRCFSAYLSQKLPHAKKSGMLQMETEHAGKSDRIWLLLQAGMALALMLTQNVLAGVLSLPALTVFALYYKKLCEKNFGGVTGDTAGFCTVCSESVLVVLYGILSLL